MTDEIVLEVNSTDYSDEWESIKIVEQANNLTTFSVNMIGDNTEMNDDIKNGSLVLIEYDSTRIFQGTVQNMNVDSDEYIRLEGITDGDWNMIGYNTGSYVEAATATNTIVSELCSELLDGAPTWLCEPDTNSVTTAINFNVYNETRIIGIKKLADRVGADWWITWDGSDDPRMNFAAERGSTFAGTATAGGNDTLTDTGSGWTVNGWTDYKVVITGGTGVGQERIVASNTSEILTVSVNWTTNPDTDSTFTIVKQVFYTYSNGSTITQNVRGVTRKRELDRMWNAWYVMGYGDGTAQKISDGSHTDAGSISSWGRHEKRTVDRGLQTDADCDARAAILLAIFKDPVNVFTVTVDEDDLVLPTQVEIGDYVMIRDNNVFFNAEGTYNTYIVRERTININPGARNVVLVCASLNWTIISDMSRILQLASEVNSYKVIDDPGHDHDYGDYGVEGHAHDTADAAPTATAGGGAMGDTTDHGISDDEFDFENTVSWNTLGTISGLGTTALVIVTGSLEFYDPDDIPADNSTIAFALMDAADDYVHSSVPLYQIPFNTLTTDNDTHSHTVDNHSHGMQLHTHSESGGGTTGTPNNNNTTGSAPGTDNDTHNHDVKANPIVFATIISGIDWDGKTLYLRAALSSDFTATVPSPVKVRFRFSVNGFGYHSHSFGGDTADTGPDVDSGDSGSSSTGVTG